MNSEATDLFRPVWWCRGRHAQTVFGVFGRPRNPFLKKRRPIDAILRMRNLPVLFIHGTKDVIVGAAHSRRLFDAAHEPKRLQLIADGGHAEMLFREDPTGFMGLITDWRKSCNLEPRDTRMSREPNPRLSRSSHRPRLTHTTP